MRVSSKSIPIQRSSWFGLGHFIAPRSLLWGAVLGILGFIVHERWFPQTIDQMVNDDLQARAVQLFSTSSSVLDKDVVILGIDEASLQLDAESVRRGAPRRSTRDVVTRALNQLRDLGPKVVAVDVLFLDAGSDPEEDVRLEAAIRRYKPNQLLLASKLTQSWNDTVNEERGPHPRFRLQGPGALAPGFVDIPEEADGFARYIQPAGVVKRGVGVAGAEGPKFHQVAEYLALAAARAYKDWPPPTRGPGGWEGRNAAGNVVYRVPVHRDQRLRIPFSEYPGSTPVIELSELLSDSSSAALANRVAGKLVFLGATYPSCEDVHRTPLSRLPSLWPTREDGQRTSSAHTASPWNERASVLTRDAETLNYRSYGVELVALSAQAIVDQGPFVGHLSEFTQELALICCGILAWGLVDAFAFGPVLMCIAVGLITACFLVPLLVFARTHVLVSPLAFVITFALVWVGRLGFYAFDEGLRRKFLQQMLSRYVSREVMEAIVANPHLLRLPGKKVEVTVVFCDLRGFTALAEGLSPALVVDVMDRFLQSMATAVLEHGGVVNKFLGDGLMAFWGAPRVDPAQAIRACQSAWAMHVKLAILDEEFTALSVGPLAIGVGINSGEAVVGSVGYEERLEYTVLGDVVNLASRIQDLTKVYGCGVLVGEGTAAKLMNPATGRGGLVTLRRVDLVRVRGRHEPTVIFEVLWPGDEERGRLYELALDAYLAGRFAEAQELFAQTATRFPTDRPTQIMLNRCREFIAQPPSSWSGCYDADARDPSISSVKSS